MMFGANFFVAIGIYLCNLILERLLVPHGTAQKSIPEKIDAKRLEDPLFAVRNPESAEMRAIYREIDEVAGIDDPDLATPSLEEIDQNKIEEGMKIVRRDFPELVEIPPSGPSIGKFPPAGKPDRPVTLAEMREILQKQGKDLSQH